VALNSLCYTTEDIAVQKKLCFGQLPLNISLYLQENFTTENFLLTFAFKKLWEVSEDFLSSPPLKINKAPIPAFTITVHPYMM